VPHPFVFLAKGWDTTDPTPVYNANNQLTQWGTTAMTYDLNGNTLNDGMNSYVWDARNRLASADNNGAVFSYDPLGRRVSKTVMTTTTNFLYDGANAVQEFGTLPTANLLTGGLDERFVRTDSTGSYDYLTDALGSTVELTDSTGTTQEQYSYGPYGMLSAAGATTANSYTYTGRESDGLGINYYRARYYNPSTGRFLSEDPMGFAAGTNFYEYAGDDPIDFNDPLGLYSGPYGPRAFPGRKPVAPAGCSVPDCGWYYGNYGGPSFTGGQWEPWEKFGDPSASGIPSNFALPIDAQDGCYLEHDRCYAQSRVKNMNNGKCNKNQDSKDTGSCDRQLVQCLNHMADTDPSAYNPGAAISSTLFWLMGLFK